MVKGLYYFRLNMVSTLSIVGVKAKLAWLYSV